MTPSNTAIRGSFHRLRELAAATRSCVESLERRMGVSPPSQPQIFVGAAVTDLRIPGR